MAVGGVSSSCTRPERVATAQAGVARGTAGYPEAVYAGAAHQARRRADSARRRIRRPDLRSQLRRARRGARARGRAEGRRLPRARADAGPLRGGRAPDLGLRHPDRVARGARPDGRPPADLRRAGGDHAPRQLALAAALDLLDLRLPRALPAAARPGRLRVRDRQGQRAQRRHDPHRPRRPQRPADRGRARLAAHARLGRLPAAGRAAVARPGGASGRALGRPGDLDRPQDRARGLRLELPRARRAAHRRRARSIRAST